MRTHETVKPTDWITEALKDAPAILTVPEACAILRCGRRNLYRLTAAGRLHGVRAHDAGSSRVLIPRASLEAYLRGMSGEVL